MTLQIGSCEHRREGLTGESWKVPVGDFTGRAAYAKALLQKLSNVLNSGEFITNDVGFSASVLFTRPETKGSKRAGGGPGQKIWDQMAKESRCVCEIKSKDTLCCATAIVVMREYSKRQADRSCKICRREFHGETCFVHHLIQYETVAKALKKMKEELEQNLDEELPNIVEIRGILQSKQRNSSQMFVSQM